MSSPSSTSPNAQSQSQSQSQSQGSRLFCYNCGELRPMDPSQALHCAVCQSDFVQIIEHDEHSEDAHNPPDGPETADTTAWTPFGMFTISSPTVFPVAGGSFTGRRYTGNGLSFTTASFATGNDHDHNTDHEHNAEPGQHEQHGHGQRTDGPPPGLGGFPFPFAPPPPYSGGPENNTGLFGIPNILQDLFSSARDNRSQTQPPPPQQQNADENTQDAATGEEPLHPRDTEQPQARVPRIMTLEQFLASMASGAPPPFAENQTPENQAPQQEPQQQQPPPPQHPPSGAASLLALFQLMSGISGGRTGDMVFSEEELQRVLQQLAEHAEPGGPLPATEDAINALPKKNVDQAMLGDDGKAECSICIESVQVGEEVTLLPCHHWFHEECIKAWLNEHDSCPHCRKPITPPEQRDQQHRRRAPNADSNNNGDAEHREHTGASPGFANLGFFPFSFFGPPPHGNPTQHPQNQPPSQPHQAQEASQSGEGERTHSPSEPHTHTPQPPNASATTSRHISFGPINAWVSTTTFPSSSSQQQQQQQQPHEGSSPETSTANPETGAPQSSNPPPFGGHPIFRLASNIFPSAAPRPETGVPVTETPGSGTPAQGGAANQRHDAQPWQEQDQGQRQEQSQEEQPRQPSFFEAISTVAFPPLQYLVNQANLFGTQSSIEPQSQQQYRSRDEEHGQGQGQRQQRQQQNPTFFGIPMGAYRSASPGRREEIRRQQQEQRYRQINEDDFDQPD